MDLLRKYFGKFPHITDQKLMEAMDLSLADGTLTVRQPLIYLLSTSPWDLVCMSALKVAVSCSPAIKCHRAGLCIFLHVTEDV
jgi:hypothetical protein